MEIVLATTNLHKIREFKAMFRSLKHLELLSLNQLSDYVAPEEIGQTFKDNAILKAVHAAQALNCWVLADDSGLVVPALKGEPGVYSRRYSGPQATDAENCKKLLGAMQHLVEPHERTAYYECCIAIASPKGLQKCVQGICEGYISSEPKGRHGFGYDPLFVLHHYKQTFAELDESIKNRISHRHKALQRLLPFLETLKD